MLSLTVSMEAGDAPGPCNVLTKTQSYKFKYELLDIQTQFFLCSKVFNRVLTECLLALAKGYYQIVNELNHYQGRNSVQNSRVHTRLSRLFTFSSQPYQNVVPA
jgi:hypothetical protein